MYQFFASHPSKSEDFSWRRSVVSYACTSDTLPAYHFSDTICIFSDMLVRYNSSSRNPTFTEILPRNRATYDGFYYVRANLANFTSLINAISNSSPTPTALYLSHNVSAYPSNCHPTTTKRIDQQPRVDKGETRERERHPEARTTGAARIILEGLSEERQISGQNKQENYPKPAPPNLADTSGAKRQMPKSTDRAMHKIPPKYTHRYVDIMQNTES